MPTYNDTTTNNVVINKLTKSIYDGITPNDTEFYIVDDNTEYQTTGNLVTSLSGSNTHTQYPSAKCTYDAMANKENAGKIKIGGVEYTVTRKALSIMDNGVTTTFYVADISS